MAEITLEGVHADLKRRLDLAEEEKNWFLPDFREAYKFMMPRRTLPGVAGRTQSKPRREQANQNFTSLGEEVATDFASDIADTFTPEHAQWAEIEVSNSVPSEILDEVREAARNYGAIVFDAIAASRFHDACKLGNKDLAVSAFGMSIEKAGPGEPYHCQPIPLSELLILRDARGGIGTRLWKRSMPADEIRNTFPGLIDEFPEEVSRALADANMRKTPFDVVQGCYRDYSVPAEQAWILCTRIGEKLVAAERKVGNGAANILVCRWDPDPCFAWGNGPGIKAIPDFRELDETVYQFLKGKARIVDPPFAHTDDQMMNFEGGLPNGVAIPMMAGSEIKIIESSHGIDQGLFAVRDVMDRIRRIFYLDEPNQEGKTPPTLGQWMDESLRRQRRLSTPAASIWPEFLAEVFMRFRYLLIQDDSLEETLPVGNMALPVRPMNPLKRASQQEEARAVEMALGAIAQLYGPELLPVVTDAGKTITNLVTLAHAKGVALMPAARINEGIAAMQQARLAAEAAKAAAPFAQIQGQQG